MQKIGKDYTLVSLHMKLKYANACCMHISMHAYMHTEKICKVCIIYCICMHAYQSLYSEATKFQKLTIFHSRASAAITSESRSASTVVSASDFRLQPDAIGVWITISRLVA